MSENSPADEDRPPDRHSIARTTLAICLVAVAALGLAAINWADNADNADNKATISLGQLCVLTLPLVAAIAAGARLGLDASGSGATPFVRRADAVGAIALGLLGFCLLFVLLQCGASAVLATEIPLRAVCLFGPLILIAFVASYVSVAYFSGSRDRSD